MNGRRRCGWEWVPSSKDSFPLGAVVGGMEGGRRTYVARAYHEQSLTPAKFSVHQRSVFLPSTDGTEFNTHRYEMLVASSDAVEWVDYDYRRGRLPLNPIPGGFSRFFHQPLFIGRCLHLEDVLIGSVEQNRRSCVVPFNGHVLTFHKHFQVLVSK